MIWHKSDFKVNDIIKVIGISRPIPMPVFYIIDNEYFVFCGDFGMTKYRNELPLLTEYNNYQLLNSNPN